MQWVARKTGKLGLRSNQEFWGNGVIPWLKTEQLGEKYIYDMREKITAVALDKTSIKINPTNTLSIAMYGEGQTRGRISILREPMTTNQACCNIMLNDEEADHEYVYYCLKNQYDNLRNLSSGVRKNLNAGDIKEFEISIPKTLSEQQKIAAILSALDAKIELNNRINAELEAMAKTLYDYWFVQFDFPSAAGRPYKSSGGKMVYNEKLKREIPKGWDVESISAIVDNVKKKTDGGALPHLPYYPIVDLPRRKLVSCTSSPNEEAQSSLVLFEKYDILLGAMRVYFHRVCLAAEDGITRTTTFILRPVQKTFQYFALMTMSADETIAFATQNSKGSTIPYTFWEGGLADLKVPVPENDVLTTFNGIMGPIFDASIFREKQTQQLSSLRDWLLPMLMNGQVQVGGAQ